MSDFYDISVTLADGTTTTMGGWAGHVLLIANPASTSAHADILAEANDAGGAATPFPYLTHAEELFEYLGEGDTFVVDTSGSVIGRFDAAVEPDELEITDLIESNLPI